MDGWEKIIALIVPLVMNWWEVRSLRKEMRETHDKHDARIGGLEERVAVLEAQTGLIR